MHSNSPQTLRSLAGLPDRPAPFAQSALVVIDAQIEYGATGALPLSGLGDALENIARLQSAARNDGTPIVHVAHVGSTGGLFDPTDGGGFLEPTAPLASEVVVHKTLPNSFARTDLASVLERFGVTNLVLVGFMTHMCVSTTARAALDLGYQTGVVSDATATRDLPAGDGSETVDASTLQRSTLAALADRFSAVTSTSELLASSAGASGAIASRT